MVQLSFPLSNFNKPSSPNHFLIPFSVVTFGRYHNMVFYYFQVLTYLWGIKNGLPSMKVKDLKNSKDKIVLEDYKWSSMNA